MRIAGLALLALAACGAASDIDRSAAERAAVMQMMAVNPLLAAPDSSANVSCVAEAATADELTQLAAVRSNAELTGAILPIMERPALRACAARMATAGTL